MQKNKLKRMLITGLLSITGLIGLNLGSSFAYGPQWQGTQALRKQVPGWQNQYQYQVQNQRVYGVVRGVVEKIKTMPGPGRGRGVPWIVLEVRTHNGEVENIALGPQWWGTPPELKERTKVEIQKFQPYGWAKRGIPYSVACVLSFPENGKTYSLRPCGWWYRGTVLKNSKNTASN